MKKWKYIKTSGGNYGRVQTSSSCYYMKLSFSNVPCMLTCLLSFWFSGFCTTDVSGGGAQRFAMKVAQWSFVQLVAVETLSSIVLKSVWKKKHTLSSHHELPGGCSSASPAPCALRPDPAGCAAGAGAPARSLRYCLGQKKPERPGHKWGRKAEEHRWLAGTQFVHHSVLVIYQRICRQEPLTAGTVRHLAAEDWWQKLIFLCFIEILCKV